MFGRLLVKRLISGPLRPIRMRPENKRRVSSQNLIAQGTFDREFNGNLDRSDVCNLGKVQAKGAKHLTRARNRPRRAAPRSLFAFTSVSVTSSPCLLFQRINP